MNTTSEMAQAAMACGMWGVWIEMDQRVERALLNGPRKDEIAMVAYLLTTLGPIDPEFLRAKAASARAGIAKLPNHEFDDQRVIASVSRKANVLEATAAALSALYPTRTRW